MAVATFILTFCLVAITYWYALQTKRMVEEMKESRTKSSIPVITCEVDLADRADTNHHFRNGVTVISTRNVGNSPSFDTTMELRLLNLDTTNLIIEPISQFLAIIGSNTKQDFYTNPATIKPGSNDPARIEITYSYSNSYKQRLQTTSVFLFEEGGIVEHGPEKWDRDWWKKVDEKIIFLD